MKKFIFFIILYSYNTLLLAQKKPTDSLNIIPLKEVIIIETSRIKHQRQNKPLATLDEYIEQSGKINMIKRGSYAWEPTINGMATERTSITIDGMQIFGACTDKMDPVTSYVDISNLQEAHISSGQQGSENNTTIGGAIDLKRKKSDFKDTGWNADFGTGYETNGDLKSYTLAVNQSNKNFYTNTNFIYRDANNYKAGGGKEVLYSQYTKYNFSTITVVRLNENKSIEGSLIFDEANDVGYPALPMDVSLARALISSFSYQQKNISPVFKNWENKIYYNTITHKMDDSKRPVVPIRMDMPGWSDTYGFYSKLQGKINTHVFAANLSAYHNTSKAEMTMYPNNPNESLMFMLTWPNVVTLNSGLYLEDKIALKENKALKLTTRIDFHNNTISDDFGLNSLQIFYPDLSKTKQRFLWSFSEEYIYTKNNFEYIIGTGYGERPPSVSEGYGFYLFNSFDGYDYIGNPNLKNEKSLEGSTAIRYKTNGFNTEITTSYFHIMDYIIGKQKPELSPMTIGSAGVRIYSTLDYVSLWNIDWSTEYLFHNEWLWKGKIGYTYGNGPDNEKIPLLRPLSYSTSLIYTHKAFTSTITIQGADKQYRYSAEYGEKATEPYILYNWYTGYNLNLNKTTVHLKTGIENIFDKRYSTYADWNHISRKGRNLFFSISFMI